MKGNKYILQWVTLGTIDAMENIDLELSRIFTITEELLIPSRVVIGFIMLILLDGE